MRPFFHLTQTMRHEVAESHSNVATRCDRQGNPFSQRVDVRLAGSPVPSCPLLARCEVCTGVGMARVCNVSRVWHVPRPGLEVSEEEIRFCGVGVHPVTSFH